MPSISTPKIHIRAVLATISVLIGGMLGFLYATAHTETYTFQKCTIEFRTTPDYFVVALLAVLCGIMALCLLFWPGDPRWGKPFRRDDEL